MESKSSGPSKGYQKQLKKETDQAPAPLQAKRDLKDYTPDYSSPTAKKWPALLEALQSGNTEVLKNLIEEGINVNLIRDGASPLMMAASKGQTEIAEILLQAGVNVNAINDDGWTALHKAACDQTGTGIVELLLQSGIDSETKNKTGKTALNVAEEKGHRDIARVIKKHQQQLRIDAQEWEGFLNTPEGRPWREKRHYESLALIFKLWWLPSPALGAVGLLLGMALGLVILSAVIGLISGLLIGLLIFLWEKKLRSYLDAIEPLPYLDIHTLREKRKAGEQVLVKKEAETKIIEEPPAQLVDPSLKGGSDESVHLEATTAAKTFGRINKKHLKTAGYAAFALVMLLLLGSIVIYRHALVRWYYTSKLGKQGVAFSDQAFLDAAARNNEEVVDLFIKAGIALNVRNEHGQTALMIVSEKGSVSLLKKIAEQDPSALNSFDKNGNTPLMTAARQGREDTAQALLEAGADVNYVVPSNEGPASALQAALDAADFGENHSNIIKYLLQHGARTTGKNKTGRSPLFFAADHGRTNAAAVLIEKGADVNDTDLDGNFPLLVAACKGHSLFVALLAEKGANMKTALSDGRTPLMCAAQEGHLDAVKMLLEKGANVNAKTTGGATALMEAAERGNVAVVKMLLDQGADPGSGYIPGSLTTFKGRMFSVSAKKNKITDVLRRIAKTASQDGYALDIGTSRDQKATSAVKASWNKALITLAEKNHLFLVAKGKEIFILPYDPAKIKRE